MGFLQKIGSWTCMKYIILLTETITHAAKNLWHSMLLTDTFLDCKSNKEDPHLLTSLFSMVNPFSKIRYFTSNNYLIFTMTIAIPSSEEF